VIYTTKHESSISYKGGRYLKSGCPRGRRSQNFLKIHESQISSC